MTILSAAIKTYPPENQIYQLLRGFGGEGYLKREGEKRTVHSKQENLDQAETDKGEGTFNIPAEHQKERGDLIEEASTKIKRK